jgi:hypothetical protein
MALAPKDRYPGQVLTGDAGYPYGKAQNRTAPGDGSGTPWEKDLVNEIFGLQQALLFEAALVPSGAAETVSSSQYVAAIRGAVGHVASLRNWKYTQRGLPGPMTQRTLLHDPKTRRWFVFGGSTATAAWTVSGARWYDINSGTFGDVAPLIAVASAAAVNATGVLLAGGQTFDPATGKLRESSDGGITWTTVRNVGSVDNNPVNAIAYSESLALWFCSVGGASTGAGYGIFTSTDRITWTNRTSGSAPPFHLIIRESPTPIILATQLIVPGPVSSNYQRSTNGTTWTTESFPVAAAGVCQGCWSDALGAFFVGGADGIYTSTTGLTGSWTRIDTTWTTPAAASSVAAFGRFLIRGDGKASADGGVTWFRALELDSQADLFFASSPSGLAAARGATGDLYIGHQLGL